MERWTYRGQSGAVVRGKSLNECDDLVAIVQKCDKLGEQERRARLITAAPVLLEVIRAINARLHGRYDDPSLLLMGPLHENVSLDFDMWTHAAIAKVEKGGA